jgi:predicted O-methyltransferase YrrM
VLREKHSFYVFESIETLRAALKKDGRQVQIVDFGTGVDRTETVRAIAVKSLQSARYAQLLFRMVHHFKSKQVLELGTSLGLTTAYLASNSSEINCVSLEGSPRIAELARENLQKLRIRNAEVVVGNIDDTLGEVLTKTKELDFVFVDANHQSVAVLNYFDKCLTKAHPATVMVFDDIYWSADMEMAWEKIKAHPRVTSTIDLFQFGIVFFNADLHKKHYKVRY